MASDTRDAREAGAAGLAAPAVNPLLQAWTAPHGLPPFGAIRPAHFEPAFEVAMREHRAELAALGAQAAAPDFDNTVAAFDRAGERLARITAVFHNLAASATDDALQAVQRRLAAPLAAHDNAVWMDEAVFARLDVLHRRRDALGLDDEQRRLLERLHLDFVRSGARLDGAARARYGAIMEELATLTTAFAQNVLHDENAYRLVLRDETELAGLPPFVRAAARQAALERGLADGDVHVITLSRSLIVPFLSFSAWRDLREQAWRAWVTRGEHAGAHDNRPLVRRILALRHEQARLLGHASYAEYALADTMAGTPAAVQALFDEVWPRALAAVGRERAELAAAMAEAGETAALEPWDWRYWAEKVRQTRYAVDDAELKPYFPLPAMVQAAFDCAGRLFGLRFTAREDLPVYHPDVRAYEVADAGGQVIGVFLQDNFARPGKRSGAWMSALRVQHRNAPDGHAVRPVILNNNNFARGADAAAAGSGAAAPTLLSLDDVRTLFHEFGHGLHGLLSDVGYRTLSGTAVLRDFVELPSQLFEHWIGEPAVLRRHARHWRSNEPMPEALLGRLEAARRFGQGYETVRFTASAMLDMAVHARADAEPPADLAAFETETLARLGHPVVAGMNHRLVHFQHLFAGSAYAAGYYVYLWAEVLDADAWQAFVEAGDPFDAATAARLRRWIYASGNSVEPGAAFAAFRGRAPRVEPMLRKKGLLPAVAA